MQNLVTGGAGFIGSHICNALIDRGEEVICLDDLSSGYLQNINHLQNNNKFTFIKKSVLNKVQIRTDKIWHFACPASPVFYMKDPIKTAKISFIGTLNMLQLAKKNKAKFLLASSSEIYGHQKSNNQKETFLGEVNSIGKRACYAEAKRLAETITNDFYNMYKTDVKIARIFNTYGNNMSINDGRVISQFIKQTLTDQKITINGDGNQTRSFCFIDDMKDALIKLMDSNLKGPFNIGSNEEISIIELAKLISKKLDKEVMIKFCEELEDEPRSRCPSIKKILDELSWSPKTSLNEGLSNTINFYRKILI